MRIEGLGFYYDDEVLLETVVHDQSERISPTALKLKIQQATIPIVSDKSKLTAHIYRLKFYQIDK